MRYKDDLEKGWVNGYFVGIRQGTNTQDALEPESDGYEPQRTAFRYGSVTPDALEPNFPEPEDPEEPEDPVDPEEPEEG